MNAEDTLNGVVVRDPYRWLEDGSSPEVQAWADKQNTAASEYLRNIPERESLRSRLSELFRTGDLYSPIPRGRLLFWTQRDPGSEKFSVRVRDSKGGERILIDPEKESFSLQGFWPSNDGKKVAFKASQNNADISVLHVRDTESGIDSAVDIIDPVRFGEPSWAADSKGFYYRWYPKNDGAIPTADRPGYVEVRFHKLGDPPENDRRIRPRTGNPGTTEHPIASTDGRWLFLNVTHSYSQNDVLVMDLSDPNRRWRAIVEGKPHRYTLRDYRSGFYVLTDEGAPNGRILRVGSNFADSHGWKEVVSEDAAARIRDFSIVAGRLLVRRERDGISQLELRELDGKLATRVALPKPGSVFDIQGRSDDETAYYTFTSYTDPVTIFSVHGSTGESAVWRGVPANVNAAEFDVEQVFFNSLDGTRVPMSIVHKKGLPRDSSAPTILYGYGGFGYSMSPSFDASLYAWLEHGGVYAIPSIRGGGEYGEEWHRAGMLTKKQNTIDDYIAAANELFRLSWTNPERLVAWGSSNGGLVVAAAITQAPQLFRGAICEVPLTDMIRYPGSGNGKIWITEYGSPLVPSEFNALLAYSPYHHVAKGTRYPATLIVTSDSDDRMDPLHARKFAAELQWASEGGTVLLKVRKNAGHAGGDSISSAVMDYADNYAFALSVVTSASSEPKPTGAAPPQ